MINNNSETTQDWQRDDDNIQNLKLKLKISTGQSENNQHLSKSKQKQTRNSNNFRQYIKYFDGIQSKCDFHIQNCLQDYQSRRKHKLVILQNHEQLKNLISYSKPIVHIVGNSFGGIIIQYQIIIGSHKLCVNLLNLSEKPPTKQLFQLGQGGYGEIYRINYDKYRSIVSKRYYFRNYTLKNEKDENQIIWNVIPNTRQISQFLCEYAICKICSFYRIGPQVISQLGFDIVCFQNCIQFYMELCTIVYLNYLNLQEQMNMNLRILHKLKIIHKDIKPSNFLYSSTYQKFVLNDFGISHSIQEQLGNLSRTYRQGTFCYMCQNMKSIPKKQSGYVDLYFNDLHGLLVSYKQLKKINKIFNRKLSFINSKLNDLYCSIYLLNLLQYQIQQQIPIKYFEENIEIFLKNCEIFQIKLQRLQYMLKIRYAGRESIMKQRIENYFLQLKFNREQKRDEMIYLIRCYGLNNSLIKQLRNMNIQNKRILELCCNDNEDKQWNKFNNLNKRMLQNQFFRQIQYLEGQQKQQQKKQNKSRLVDILFQFFKIKIRNTRDDQFLQIFQKIQKYYNHNQILQYQKYKTCQLLIQIKLHILHMKTQIRNLQIEKIFNQYPNLKLQIIRNIVEIFYSQQDNRMASQVLRYSQLLFQSLNSNNYNNSYLTQMLKTLKMIYFNHIKLNKQSDAMQTLQRLKILCEQYYEIKSSKTKLNIVMKCLEYLGFYYKIKGKYNKSIEYYFQREKLIKLNYGVNCRNIDYLYYQIGQCLFHKQQFSKAQVYLEQEWEIYKISPYQYQEQIIINSLYRLILVNLIKQDYNNFSYYFQQISQFHFGKLAHQQKIDLKMFNEQQLDLSFTDLEKYDILVKELNIQNERFNYVKKVFVFYLRKYLTIFITQKTIIQQIIKYCKGKNIQSKYILKLKKQINDKQIKLKHYNQTLFRIVIKSNVLIDLHKAQQFNKQLPISNKQLLQEFYATIAQRYYVQGWYQQTIHYLKKNKGLLIKQKKQRQINECLKNLIFTLFKIQKYKECIYYIRYFYMNNRNIEMYQNHFKKLIISLFKQNKGKQILKEIQKKLNRIRNDDEYKFSLRYIKSRKQRDILCIIYNLKDYLQKNVSKLKQFRNIKITKNVLYKKLKSKRYKNINEIKARLVQSMF